jgi:hypothetical protein
VQALADFVPLSRAWALTLSKIYRAVMSASSTPKRAHRGSPDGRRRNSVSASPQVTGLPKHETRDVSLDKLPALDKAQVVALLLAEDSQRGWPTAVAKHGFDEWLTGVGSGFSLPHRGVVLLTLFFVMTEERQKALRVKWLPHSQWRCVHTVVGDAIVAVALLSHDDTRVSTVLLTFLCAKAWVSDEGERHGGFGSNLLREVIRRFHAGDLDSITSYSCKGEATARRLVLETDAP